MRAILFLLLTTIIPLAAAEGPRLLMLKFNNTSHDPNYDYLEDSISDSVMTYLRERFIFQQISDGDRDEYIHENYYKDRDFFTESVSMKLGIELNQDVVIAGNYWIATGKIVTHVRIIDVRNKKNVAEFEMSGPTGSNIFVSVEQIAVRIAKEAEIILPNKEVYAKRGVRGFSSGPFLSHWIFGARVGGQMYFGGYHEYFRPDQPSFGGLLRAFTPFFKHHLGFQLDLMYMSHALSDKNPSNLSDFGLQAATSNIMGGASVVFEIPRGRRWSFLPYAGFGYIYQTTTISGSLNQTVTNGLPYIQVGLDAAFAINRMIDITFGPRMYASFQGEKANYIAQFSAGANLKF